MAAEPSVYDDEVVATYDLIASAIAPGEGFAAWVGSLQELDGAAVLDLGSGTGVSSVALRNAGAHVTAVDASEASLEILASKAHDDPIRTVVADFRSVRLDERFDAVVMSRNTFFLAQTQEGKKALLHTIAFHLGDGGRAYIDCVDPQGFLRSGGDATSVSLPLGRERILTLTQTADRSTQQILSLFLVQSASGIVAFHESATWASLAEIRLLAAEAGLTVTRTCGSYAGEAYTARSREMLIVLEKA